MTITGETIDRDLTDSEIKKVEERLGGYLPDWFDLLEMAINDAACLRASHRQIGKQMLSYFKISLN